MKIANLVCFAIAAVLFALLALVRCKWALLVGCAAIIASAILCGRMTADWTYCPECRATLSCIRLL